METFWHGNEKHKGPKTIKKLEDLFPNHAGFGV